MPFRIFEDESGLRALSSFGTNKDEYGYVTYVPRARVSARATLQNATMVIEYYSRPVRGKFNGDRIKIDHVPLPPLGQGERVVVDGSGVRLHKTEYKSRYYSSRYTSGREIYGFLISVYDDRGQMVFQQGSPNSVCKYASTQMRKPQRFVE